MPKSIIGNFQSIIDSGLSLRHKYVGQVRPLNYHIVQKFDEEKL